MTTCIGSTLRTGSHLLAPTATNLERYGQKNHIYAGFHSDLNYLVRRFNLESALAFKMFYCRQFMVVLAIQVFTSGHVMQAKESQFQCLPVICLYKPESS